MTTYSVTAGQTLSTVAGTTTQVVMSGGAQVSSWTAASGDVIIVSSGGVTSNLTVFSGETVSALNATSATSTTVSSGGVFFQVGGNMTVSAAAVYDGGTLVINRASKASDISAYAGALIVDADTASDFGPLTSVSSGAQIEVVQTYSGQVTGVTEDSSGVISVADADVGDYTIDLPSSGGFTSTYIVNQPYSDSNGDAALLLTILCYAEGTLIRAANGERAVETIQPGDTVTVVRDGRPCEEVAAWVGSTRIDLARHAHPELAAPIRVKVGALAENVPVRDLLLSPEHCLILNDRCVPVKLLVNGASIAREFPSEPFTYYHIELERHGILLAEGAQSESYLDTGNRANFDNADAPRVLHPTFEVNPTAERWKTDACAPLASVPDEVAPIWQSLANRAVELGMIIPMPKLIENPDLHLIVDGKRIQPTSDRNNRYVFMVPAGAKSVTLASRFCIPADKMIPGMRDTRRLGVSVEWMAIRTTTNETILPADHPALTSGWNAVETDGAKMWRWTNGAATIPWDGIEGSAVLTIRCAPVAQYPVYDDKMRLVA